jgi:hypothetical protein
MKKKNLTKGFKKKKKDKTYLDETDKITLSARVRGSRHFMALNSPWNVPCIIDIIILVFFLCFE